MTNVLHLVLGDSAGGSLKQACEELGVPGTIFPIPDELSHGPLDDGKKRAAYFAEMWDAGELEVPADAFASWDELKAVREAGRFDLIVIWYSETISDLLFLRMACWHIRDFDGPVEAVNTSISGW